MDPFRGSAPRDPLVSDAAISRYDLARVWRLTTTGPS